jgi:hypothetical protein
VGQFTDIKGIKKEMFQRLELICSKPSEEQAVINDRAWSDIWPHPTG